MIFKLKNKINRPQILFEKTPVLYKDVFYKVLWEKHLDDSLETISIVMLRNGKCVFTENRAYIDNLINRDSSETLYVDEVKKMFQLYDLNEEKHNLKYKQREVLKNWNGVIE